MQASSFANFVSHADDDVPTPSGSDDAFGKAGSSELMVLNRSFNGFESGSQKFDKILPKKDAVNFGHGQLGTREQWIRVQLGLNQLSHLRLAMPAVGPSARPAR